jgi:hypothetical protein
MRHRRRVRVRRVADWVLAACKKRMNEATGLYDYAVWAMNGGKFWATPDGGGLTGCVYYNIEGVERSRNCLWEWEHQYTTWTKTNPKR